MELPKTFLEQHLEDLFVAVFSYLQNLHYRPDVNDVPQPEPLGILYQLRNFQTTYWPGGLANQPSILLMELNKCIEAENRINAFVANEELRLKEREEADKEKPSKPSFRKK